MVVGVLGILKAGGAYVPLDPIYPPSGSPTWRTMRQAGAGAHAAGVVAIGWTAGSPGLCLDSEWEAVAGCAAGNPAPLAEARAPGVRDLHLGLDRTPQGRERAARRHRQPAALDAGCLPLTRRDRVLQKTPFSFDVSVWEFFWPLLLRGDAGHGAPGRPPGSGVPVGADRRGSDHGAALRAVDARMFLNGNRGPTPGSLKQVICSGRGAAARVAEALLQARCRALNCITCTVRPKPRWM